MSRKLSHVPDAPACAPGPRPAPGEAAANPALDPRLVCTGLVTRGTKAAYQRTEGTPDGRQGGRSIDHPELGVLQVDCDILTTHRNDLRVVVYTAAPGSPSAKALEEPGATCADRLPLMDLAWGKSTE